MDEVLFLPDDSLLMEGGVSISFFQITHP
jgi:hypothetical protein